MPNVVDIIQSVQVPQLIKDPFICQGKPVLDGRGRLIHYTGGFAVAFPFVINGEKWALRCWSANIGNVENRLRTLSKELSDQNLPFFCDFTYETEGITINGVNFPTTRMRWIDGQTIKDYLCTNKEDSNKIKQLADNFLIMCKELHKRQIAHGDLQHGNILVDNSGDLYLIDYDSVFLPALKGVDDFISGLADYQHPKRKENKKASAKLDYFSELIIYLSIIVIADDPTFVEKYQIEDADRLLFAKDDYLDLKNSQIYKDIKSLGGKFADLLEVLEDYLNENDINSLHPFNEQLLDKQITFKSSTNKAIRSKQSVKIFWQVPFEADVSIQQLGLPAIKSGIQGSMNVILDDDAEFELKIVTKDGILIKKVIKINIFDECIISFAANKKVVFPSLPVLLSWSVTNAKKVWLNTEEVDSSGSKIVEPISDTVYILKAEDEFGMKYDRITIQTFPIKQMKILLASPPNFTIKQSFLVKRPKYNVDVNFPMINFDWIKLEIPKVKSLKELGLNVESSPPLSSSEFGLKNTIKKVYNHILRK